LPTPGWCRLARTGLGTSAASAPAASGARQACWRIGSGDSRRKGRRTGQGPPPAGPAVSPLWLCPLGRAVAPQAGTGRGQPRVGLGRLPRRRPAPRRRRAVAARSAGALPQMPPRPAPRAATPPRMGALCARPAPETWSGATSDLRLPRLAAHGRPNAAREGDGPALPQRPTATPDTPRGPAASARA